MLSLLLVYANAALGPIEFAIVLPTILEYISCLKGSTFQLGLAIASFNFARTLGFPILGFLGDKVGLKRVFILANLIGALGGLVYALAPNAATLIFGRILSGLGAANATLSLSFVTLASGSDQERHRKLSGIQAIQVPALALGPVFAFAVRDAGFQAGNLKITRLNAPGYMIFVANVLFSLLFLLGFSDPKPQSTPLPEEEKNTKTAVELTSKHQESEIIVYSSRHMLKIVLWENGGWLHLVIKFIAGFQQYAMETAITPITRTQFNWGSFENAIALLLIAIVG